MKTIVYATSVLLIVWCQALVADSGSTTPPPPPTVDVTVNTTVDTTPIAQQMSSETTTMNNDFSGLSNAVGTVGSVLTGGFSSLLGGLFGGLFGGPLRVQDDKALFKLVTEVITTAEQLIQVKNQLKLWKKQVETLSGLDGYRNAFGQMKSLAARDLFGNVSPLASAANSGFGADGAYQVATAPLVFRTLDGLPADKLRKREAYYGDAELGDGSNVAAWNLIGQTRANAQNNSALLNGLMEQNSSPDVTMVEATQKNSVTTAIAAQHLQSLEQLAASQLEQQVLATQRWRNEAADRFAAEARMQQAAQAVAGMSDNLQPLTSLVIP